MKKTPKLKKTKTGLFKYPPIDGKRMSATQRAQFKKLYYDLFWVIWEGSKVMSLSKDEADRLAWNCAYEVVANHINPL